MKIQIELDERCQQTEIIIRCAQLNEEVTRMQKQLQEIASMQEEISFFKENTEYFVKLSAVLFFETDGREVHAHTAAEKCTAPRDACMSSRRSCPHASCASLNRPS